MSWSWRAPARPLWAGGLCAAAGLATAGPDPACFSLAPGEWHALPGRALTLKVIDVREHVCPPPIICLLPNRRLVRIAIGAGDAAPVLEFNAWHADVAQRSAQVADGWLTVEPSAALCPLALVKPKRALPPASGVRPALPYTLQSTAPVRLRWAVDLPSTAPTGQTGRTSP